VDLGAEARCGERPVFKKELRVIYGKPIAELIERRFSCRTYAARPIAAETQERLRDFMASLDAGPFGTPLRFELVAASDEDRAALKGLGTYGFIRGASGFIVGAAGHGAKDLEDYGYAMESLLLASTDLDLGTCWLGGTFTRSSFSRRIQASGDEQVPAVAAVGYIANPERARRGLLRRVTNASSRLPWERLFFDQRFGAPLARDCAGGFAQVLDLVRLAPSGSNKQPWRIVKDREAWHFYLERTPGYGGGLATRLLGGKGAAFPDIQRMDLGIAICHFDLASREMNMSGTWVVDDPSLAGRSALTEYVASFVS
jgi:nitroreductase